VKCLGITNQCADGRHVFFADYDSYLLKKVEDECRRLINEFKMSDFLIFETSPNHYYIVCFDKFNYWELVDILKTTHADRKFIDKHRKGFPYKCDIMRFSRKGKKAAPRFIERIQSSFNEREQSLAHIIFFRNIFRIHNYTYKTDGFRSVNIQQYEVKK
jgi:hypothetical protein